jgi:hypothetical protein
VTNSNRKKTFLIIWVLLLLGAVLLLNRYFNGKTDVKYKKYLVIGKENIFVVYDDKVSLKIPQDTYVGQEKMVLDYLNKKEYSELFQVIKSIFPEELEGYIVPKRNVDVATDYSVNIPTISNNNKNYILTSELNKVFINLYYGTINEKADNILIDILNASGKVGLSKKIGEKLQKDFGFRYNPATYEENSEYSYIINNSLSQKQVEDLIMSLDSKYIKIKDKSKLPTPANAVVIIGRETEGILSINIYKNGEIDKENYNKLNKNYYINLKTTVTKEKIEDTYIEYKAEDYYTAYKISKLLGIDKLVENKEISNKINIYVK